MLMEVPVISAGKSFAALFSLSVFLMAAAASFADDGDKKIYAYKNVKWTDSIDAAIKALGQGRELGPDRFGRYCFTRMLDTALEELPSVPADAKDEEKAKEKELKRDVIERLNAVYHMKMVNMEAGKSEASLFWLETNNKSRKSAMVDDILSSEMAYVRVVYNPDIKFSDVLAKQKEHFGEPQKLKSQKMLWSGLREIKSVKEKEEFYWDKDGLVVRLYDWTEEGAGAEIIIQRQATIIKYCRAMCAETKNILDGIKKSKDSELNAAVNF
jgi:hypothetical protein